MKVAQLRRVLFSSAGWALALGLMMFIVAIQIFVTGKIRAVLVLGEERYPLAVFLFCFAAWVTYLGIKGAISEYRKG